MKPFPSTTQKTRTNASKSKTHTHASRSRGARREPWRARSEPLLKINTTEGGTS